MQHRGLRHPLSALLLLSGMSYLFALNWGLPSVSTWAPDELVPDLVRGGLQSSFLGGWHTQYPPLHFFLIVLFSSPFLIFDLSPNYALTIIGRLLSVFMAIGALVALYGIARRFLETSWSLVGVAIFAFTPQTVYYAKVANLDIPYLFWFLCSLYVFWSILDRHRTRDYLLFSLLSVTAVCTKEQVYGFYVLLIPLLFYSRSSSKKVARTFFDRNILYSFLVCSIGFILFQNILFHPDGFVNHLALITGAKFRGYSFFQHDLQGHLGMLLLSVEQLAFVLSIPVLLFCAIGVAASIRSKAGHCWLLLPIVSYQIFLLHLVMYSFDRFYLPDAAILALFAAYGLRSISVKHSTIAKSAAALLLAFQFVRSGELNLMMHFDTRYEVEEWMEQNVPTDRVVGLFGLRRYLPRYHKYRKLKTVSHWKTEFRDIRPKPDCVLTLFAPPKEWEVDDPSRSFMGALKSGELGLHKVFGANQKVLGSVFFNPRSFLGNPQYRTSNLAKISPTSRVYSLGGQCLPNTTAMASRTLKTGFK